MKTVALALWYACSQGHLVTLPEGGGWTDQARACALRHEFGHLNGWAFTHPGAHFEDGCGAIALPPSEYDHVPTTIAVIQSVPFGLVDKRCGDGAPLAGVP